MGGAEDSLFAQDVNSFYLAKKSITTPFFTFISSEKVGFF